MLQSAESLVAACLSAAEAGDDFPAVWQKILRSHPHVAGLPIQRMDAGIALLEIPLTTGQRIVVGPGFHDYALASGKGETAVI